MVSALIMDSYKGFDIDSLFKVVSVKKKKRGKSRRRGSSKETKDNAKDKSDITASPLLSTRSMGTFDMDNRDDLDSDSEPDRGNPEWKVVSDKEETPEQEINGIDESKNIELTLWEQIMAEYEEQRLEYENLMELKKPYEPPLPVLPKLSAVQYLQKYIFPSLCPALEDVLIKAKEWDCLSIQKCLFSGLDYLAELLWNKNPLHPNRLSTYLKIFDIPFVIIWLHYNPRPIFPLSWVMTKEDASTVLQKYIRRYLVCREPECAEMRQFWKTLEKEKQEEIQAKREKIIAQIEKMFHDIFNKIVSEAVYQSEWKKHGCNCNKKPCRCTCKCEQWCKCCKCYKDPPYHTKPCDCKTYTENI